jgi:hypothetical protein
LKCRPIWNFGFVDLRFDEQFSFWWPKLSVLPGGFSTFGPHAKICENRVTRGVALKWYSVRIAERTFSVQALATVRWCRERKSHFAMRLQCLF